MSRQTTSRDEEEFYDWEDLDEEQIRAAEGYYYMKFLEDEERCKMNHSRAKNTIQAPLTNSRGLKINYLGAMSEKCGNCDARFFEAELMPGNQNEIDFCCMSGTIKLASPFVDFPENLKEEFKDPCRRSNIVNNNNEVAFAKFHKEPIKWLETNYRQPGNWVCKGRVKHIAVSPENYEANDCLPNNWIANAYDQMKQGLENVNPVNFLLGTSTLDSKNLFLSNSNPLIDPMAYPFFFPSGAKGWHADLKIPQAEYYRYLAMVRDTFNPLHHGTVLTRQFFMDVWARIDQNCLQNYPKGSNQLPSSHPGSYRNLMEEYFDSIAVFSKYGSADITVIFTCNPGWQEIQENLVIGQDAHDRPDLIARVFKLKVDRMLHHLLEDNLLGKVAAYVMCYEWQKRGLPHIHLALAMEGEDKNPEKLASVFTDQLPDESDQVLYQTVMERMLDKDGIASYNPDLLRIFDAHIHVKECASYYPKLYKYIHKGSNPEAKEELPFDSDEEKTFNEVKHYLKNRTFCAPEACHRLFGFPVFQRSHQVHRLQIHLPSEDEPMEPTQQTEFFKLNRTFKDMCTGGELVTGMVDPQKVTYQNFPSKFSWNGEEWQEKEKPDEGIIGWITPVTPRDKEMFALRQLLIYIPGATCFEDLLEVPNSDGSSVIKATFHEAAKAQGLLTIHEIRKGYKEYDQLKF